MTPQTWVERAHAVMREKGGTLAVAESLTSGNLQAAIASKSGASDFFQGGITAYSRRQKVRYLGVDDEHARSVNCVSEQVARQMASGTRSMFAVDVAVSTTGYASPTADGRQYAWIAVDDRGVIRSREVLAKEPMERVDMQQWVVGEALQLLCETLTR